MRDINKKFSVRYYLNLVLIDEEERRYFKQQVKTRPLCVLIYSFCLHFRFCSSWEAASRFLLSVCVDLPSAGNHTVEERRRGEEEHVPPGRHRLPEVRGLSRFRERTGTGRQGRERVVLPPSGPVSIQVTTPCSIWRVSRFICSRHCWWRKGDTQTETACELWNRLYEAFWMASGSRRVFFKGNQANHLSAVCPVRWWNPTFFNLVTSWCSSDYLISDLTVLKSRLWNKWISYIPCLLNAFLTLSQNKQKNLS